MKNNLKSVFAVLFIVAFTDLHSQIKPQYTIGLNLSGMTVINNGIESDTKTAMGIHYGVMMEIPVIGNSALLSSLMFTSKGSDYKIDNLGISISPIYIEVSALPEYCIGHKMLKILLFAGPYFACGIGGYKLESGGEIKSISYGSGEGNDIRPLDAGINVGAGIKIKKLMITANYGIGLLDINPLKTVDSEMKNKVIGISISSLFESK